MLPTRRIQQNLNLEVLSAWSMYKQLIAAFLIACAGGWIFLSVYFAPALIFQDPEAWGDSGRILKRAITFWLCIATFWVAALLLSTPKYTVLYLRRFRSDLTSFMSRNIERGLGRRFRIIALDDARFLPLEVPWIERWFSRMSPFLIFVSVLGFVIFTIAVLLRTPYYVDVRGHMSYQLTIMFAFWTIQLWTLFLLFFAHRSRVRRHAKIRVNRHKDLWRALYAARILGKFLMRPALMAPQATIVKCVDDMWTHAVRSLGSETDAVLLDISEPSPNLEWEVRVIIQCRLPHLFMAETRQFATWARASSTAHSISPSISSLHALLKNETILLYDVETDQNGKMFRFNLDRALQYAVRGNQCRRIRDSVGFFKPVWHRMAAACYYLVVFSVGLLTGFWLQNALRAVLWPQYFS